VPVAAGLGGGSADAAAALRLLARVNGLGLDDPRLRDAARATGADVPVCLDPRSRVMRGTGDVLSGPLELPALPALLVNPRVPVATRDVFAALRAKPLSNSSAADPARFAATTPAALVELLRGEPNDLEAPAIALQPVVAEVLSRLHATPGALLARMSGSGATCFALYATPEMAAAAGRELAASYPGWWSCATLLG
jgi:4-diphosphocytidyl-2-C-methyl-D-erythritol kinase